MDWHTHASAFQSQWILRYVDPSDSSWKAVLDAMILKDKRGKDLHSTRGRGVLFAHLNAYDKCKILRRLPKRATYIKECLRAHWKLQITLDTSQIHGIHSEPLWRNHRFSLNLHYTQERFFAHQLRLKSLGDILNHKRNPRTKRQWIKYIQDSNVMDVWINHNQPS